MMLLANKGRQRSNETDLAGFFQGWGLSPLNFKIRSDGCQILRFATGQAELRARELSMRVA